MNPKTINRNLYTSGALCAGALVLAGLCLLLHLPEYAALLGFLALIQAVMFGVWLARRRKPANRFRPHQPDSKA